MLKRVPWLLALALLPPATVGSTPPPASAPRGVLGTYVRGPEHLQAGSPAALRIACHAATSAEASAPFPGVEVQVRLEGKDRRQALYAGRTDAAGVADARFTVPDWPAGSYTIVVEARAGGRRDTRRHEVSIAEGGKLLLESDKPLYQPGQTLHLRALALSSQTGRPIAATQVTFTVADPRGNRVFRATQPLSAFGVAAADFTLADEILTGPWRATAQLGDGQSDGPQHTLELQVARYVLPKLKLALETDRPYYAPGERARLTVDGRYFFGKPVAGGRVTVTATLSAAGGVKLALGTLHGTLDADGKARLELTLPRELAEAEATLALSAALTDAADHHEETTRELLVARDPVRLELTPEAPRLVPGVENRVWVAATRPDGAPVAGAELEVRSGGAALARVKTDAVGVAEVHLAPRSGGSARCGAGGVELRAGLHQAGVVSWTDRCLPVAPPGSLLLRSDRALYPAGAPLELELQGLGPDGPAYVDVVRDGQVIDTAEIVMRGGRGSTRLPPDERRSGTLALEAYRVQPDGTRTRDARVVYVERPGALTVEVHPEQASFRPGERGRIHLKVLDAATKAGAQAQLGVVMVDQSLLALKAMRPGAARLYFTLAAEATQPQLQLKARPGGYTVERLLELPGGALDALQQEAARILLAGAQPPWRGWEIDPFQERKDEELAQLDRLSQQLAKWVRTHAPGERVGKRWRWRRDLLSQMIADGTLAPREAHDPWGRRIASETIVQQAGLGDLDDWARQQVDERLTALYRAIARAGLERTLPADAAGGKRAVILTQADLEKLAAEGKLPRWLLVDPWGQPWRIDERKRAIQVATLRSRFVIASRGPDGVVGNGDDLYPIDQSRGRFRRGAWALDDVLVGGAPAGEAFGPGRIGLGGFGTIGYGAGAGGFGRAYPMALSRAESGGFDAASPRPSSPGGAQAGGAAEVRVRRDFPETLLWRPDVITDEHGEATLEVAFADSITTWQLTAEAVARDGRLGHATAEVRVFQDFFADLDLPPVVTQHDELAVPVAVYNYLPSPQRVTLALEDAPWFERLSEATQAIDLAPSQVGVRYFRIRAKSVGQKRLLVRAQGTSAADAIEKPIEIIPDGTERALSYQDRLDAGRREHAFTIPANAIADASLAQLKVYPSTATHVIEGLDSLLRVPGGCFEQTSSTTYPNALILQYLQQTRKSTPEIERKARAYLQAGYQRLLSFEVRGGGFSWFGSAPANQILTAYGLEEFADMAKVQDVDRRVIERTRNWLLQRQRPDGSWAPDTQFINEGATNHFNTDLVRITAYIAVALEHSGYRGPALERARAFVRGKTKAAPSRDPYTLALVTELESGRKGEAGALDAVLEQLWAERRDEAQVSSFPAREKTPMYGDGKSATVETTALAAFAMLTSGAEAGMTGRIDRAVGYLLSAKDTFGNWYSTQATILSLKALLAFGARDQAKPRGTLAVDVDGHEVARLPIDGAAEGLQALALPAAARAGAHRVAVRFDGKGSLSYQLVGRYWEPRANAAPAPSPSGDLQVATQLDRARLSQGGELTERVRASVRGAAVDMPIVTAGLPPGFDVDRDELDELVKAHRVEKVQQSPRELTFYLTRLEEAKPFAVALHLRARFPAQVQVPAATVYEYYQPERRAEGTPLLVRVDG